MVTVPLICAEYTLRRKKGRIYYYPFMGGSMRTFFRAFTAEMIAGVKNVIHKNSSSI